MVIPYGRQSAGDDDVRAVDKNQWNGLRTSQHLYNDVSNLGILLDALRREGSG